MTEQASGLALLRVPFPAHQISYLPKGGTKLAYVGHAALTDRLLDADPMWSWEPLSMSESGLPVFDGFGGMWIKLTVCGVTRLGYGHAGTKDGGDAIKEVIGDALRNAAMRFGAALDLWHKGDLHAEPASLEPVLEASIAQAKKTGARHTAAADAGTRLSGQTRTALDKLGLRLSTTFAEQGVEAAYDLLEEQGLTGDERTYLWGTAGMDPSGIRSALKQENDTRALRRMAKAEGLMQAHTTA
jgi:hypothetical protein